MYKYKKYLIEYYINKRYFARDYTGIIEMFDTTKLVSESTDLKVITYYLLGIQDSTKYYGQLFLDNTDDNDTPSGIAAEYHDGIVWQAVAHYAQHFEDGSKLQEAMDRFIPYKKYFEMRAMPDVSVDLSAMYRRPGI